MIKLTSHPTEEALARLAGCAAEAKAAADAQTPIPPGVAACYRHSDVKAAVLAETNGKCAYCEAKITHVYFGDVEHIKPKSRFPDQSLVYGNLTLACAICNNRKGNYFDGQAPILDPYADSPEEHLVGLGSFVWHRNGSALGQRTIDLLALNRDQLCEKREDRLSSVSAIADRYVNAAIGELKEALADQLRREVEGTSEFALTIRSFLLAAHGLDWQAI